MTVFGDKSRVEWSTCQTLDFVENQVVLQQARVTLVDLDAERVELAGQVRCAHFEIGVDAHATAPNKDLAFSSQRQAVIVAASDVFDEKLGSACVY